MYTLNFNHILYFITCSISYIQWCQPPMSSFTLNMLISVTVTPYVLRLHLVRFSKLRSTSIQFGVLCVALQIRSKEGNILYHLG